MHTFFLFLVIQVSIFLSCSQVLYHLTQLTLAVTPRTTLYSVQTKKQDESLQKNTEEMAICQDSLEEVFL